MFWTAEELSAIGKAEELDLVSLRADGSPHKPVTIWVVRVGDDLYVRAYKGITGPWYRGTQILHKGHIRSGGVEKEVDFVAVADSVINARIDAAYRQKYGHYAAEYVDPMLAPAAREATLKLVPHSED